MPTLSSLPSEQPIEVFISYAHHDETLRVQLGNHLSILERDNRIRAWHDRKIPPGKEWAREIDDRVNQARVILLLVSSDFLASDYCFDIEMKRAMERHENGEAVVVPVILRDCLWGDAPFGKLQALPKEGKAVEDWEKSDNAFRNIAESIRDIVGGLTARAFPSGSAPGAEPSFGEEVYRLCNRDDQEDEFEALLRQDAPVRVCAIRASETDLPESLATRLTHFSLRKHVRGVVTGKLIAWPDYKDPAEGRQSLISRVYRELDCEERELSAEAFVRAVSSRLEGAIVLRHNLRAERWNEDGRELLRSYLGFWDEVNTRGPAPRFVIFFNLIHPERPRSLLRSLLPRGRFDRERFDRDLRDLFKSAAPACPKRLLTELPRIESHHVQDWFDRHGILDPSDRLHRCRQLFAERPRRPMIEIEPALKQLHHEFLKQRG